MAAHQMDPFDEVKRDVELNMDGHGSEPGLNGMFERWKELMEEPAPKQAQIEEMAWMQSELNKKLRQVEWDLKDMQETIDIVMKQPSRFQIGEDELDTRHSFVDMMNTQVGNMKAMLDRASRRPPPRIAPTDFGAGRTKGGYESLDAAEAAALDAQVQEQFAQQDEQLDETVMPAVGRLQQMAGEVKGELRDQDGMLDELDKGIDGVRGSLGRAMARLDKVAASMSNTKKLVVIFLLFVVLIIMVIFTFGS